MEADTAPVIRTFDLTKRFKNVTAVDEVSFSVQRGEVFGFLGPNGAGKTTTIAMLLGLVHPTAGSAEVLDCDIRRDLSKALRKVGSIVETPSFYPYMSGADNLLLLARLEQCLDLLLRAGIRPVALKGLDVLHRFRRPFDERTLDSAGQRLARSRQPKDRGYGRPDRGQFDRDEEVFGACAAAALYRRTMLESIPAISGLEISCRNTRLLWVICE